MTTIVTVVYNDVEAKKHMPTEGGDKIAGSLVQLSTDATQTMTLGTDGGLLVSAVAELPDYQVLIGDPSGSVVLELTPQVKPNGDTNYIIKGDVKIDPAAGNAAVATSSGLYVPTPTVPTFVVGNAPTVVDDGTTTTQYFGGNTVALGDPVGWEKRVGTTKVYPLYDEGSVSGGATSVSGKQVEFGTQASTTAYHQTHVITFATAFPTVPFVTLTSSIQEDWLQWKALDITTTGFTLEGYGISQNSFTGNVNWKAEEK